MHKAGGVVYIIVGLLLILMAIAGSVVKRLPITTAMLYLGVGVAIGPFGAGLVDVEAVTESALLERVTEIAVIVSLFTAGLKLRAPLADPLWRPAFRLAVVSMTVSVALVATAGFFGAGLSLGPAILLGAILAPTDPVLASDVQVGGPGDRDRLRFTLTGEAGLNDGTAFPFVMLGLGLAGAHDLGAAGWRWLVVDVVWASVGGLGIGWGLGTAVARLVVWLRQAPGGAVAREEYLTLGLIALAYGVALGARTYGFLAVFAAGLAVRRIERETTPDDPRSGDLEDAAEAARAAADPTRAPAYMAHAVLGFTAQLERLFEVGLVLLVGAMLGPGAITGDSLWFVPLLVLVVRPASVAVGLVAARVPADERRLVAWFGVRGIGSLYYLAYATQHGLPVEPAGRIAGLTLMAITASVVLHGLSVTPLMAWYERRRERLGGP